MDFEWDAVKDRRCRAERGFGFADVLAAFLDPGRRVVPDTRHDYGEVRHILFGRVEGRLFAIVFTDRGGRLRIISARKASARERRTHGGGEGEPGG